MSPDLDAVTSAWMVKRFMPGFADAIPTFVPAGQTYKKAPPDSDPDIIHTDTGLGKFDHHQSNEFVCATSKVFDHLKNRGVLKKNDVEPLRRIADFVTKIDHFKEIDFPDPTSDLYDFCLYRFMDGLKPHLKDDLKIFEFGSTALEGILQVIRNKIFAEREIKEGYVFNSFCGKSLALESSNEETLKLSLMMGYDLVVRKDHEKGFVRIKTAPRDDLDLTPLYPLLQKADPKATWFLHASRHMLLNGSSKNPTTVPSVLPLKKVIEIIKEI